MDEYLKQVLDQVRCKKAHSFIQEELQSHLEDQIADNMSVGMDRASAEAAAVKDMGDPVETGVSLDHVHRPQVAWKLLLLMGIISVIAVIIQFGVKAQYGVGENADFVYGSGQRFLMQIIIGFVLMCVVYLLDYSWIVKWARIIGLFLIAIAGLTAFFGISVGGRNTYLTMGGIPIMAHYLIFGRFAVNTQMLIFLFVPVFGGILYSYRGKGVKGMLISIVWMIVPVFFVMKMPSLGVAMMLLASMLIMLTVAVGKGWFVQKKGLAMSLLWAIFAGLPLLMLGALYWSQRMPAYQQDRLQAFFARTGDAGYTMRTMHTYLMHSQLVGESARDLDYYLPAFNSDSILIYIATSYGLLAVVGICILAAILIIAILNTVTKVSNQAGMMMGIGCGVILLLCILFNVLVTLGFLPYMTTIFPFLSAGGSGLVVSYILVGIVLSIYRYKNVCYRPKISHFRIHIKVTRV